jgi:hypothetical protein
MEISTTLPAKSPTLVSSLTTLLRTRTSSVHGAILELHLKEENASLLPMMHFARILDSGTSLVIPIMEQPEEQMEQQEEQMERKIPHALTQATCTSALPTYLKLT